MYNFYDDYKDPISEIEQEQIHKNWSFKVLEGIVKVDASAPDMEEAEELGREDAI